MSRYGREVNQKKDSLFFVSNAIKPNSKVLDLGCWEGALGDFLIKNKNCIVDGVELNKVAAGKARGKYRNVFEFDLELAEFDDNHEKYDYIVCADVLEHLRNPELLLANLRNILNESGEVIISIPNISYGGVIAEIVNDHFYYRPTGILDSTHYRFFTYVTLTEMINQCGYNISNVDYVVAHMFESEFANNFEGEDRFNLATLLSRVENSGVYQFVVTCKPNHGNLIPFIPHQHSKNTLRFRTQVYWADDPHCFSEENSIISLSKLNKANKLTINIPQQKESCFIRVDIADFYGAFSIKSIIVSDASGKKLYELSSETFDRCDFKVNGGELYLSNVSDESIVFFSESNDSNIILYVDSTSSIKSGDWLVNMDFEYLDSVVNYRKLIEVSLKIDKLNKSKCEIEHALELTKNELICKSNDIDNYKKLLELAQCSTWCKLTKIKMAFKNLFFGNKKK